MSQNGFFPERRSGVDLLTTKGLSAYHRTHGKPRSPTDNKCFERPTDRTPKDANRPQIIPVICSG